MEFKKTASPKSENGSVKTKSNKSAMQSSQLIKLFEDELKDIYWAEKALVKAIPKMIKNATSPELNDALTAHLEQTHVHVSRLDEVFGLVSVKPVAKKWKPWKA